MPDTVEMETKEKVQEQLELVMKNLSSGMILLWLENNWSDQVAEGKCEKAIPEACIASFMKQKSRVNKPKYEFPYLIELMLAEQPFFMTGLASEVEVSFDLFDTEGKLKYSGTVELETSKLTWSNSSANESSVGEREQRTRSKGSDEHAVSNDSPLDFAPPESESLDEPEETESDENTPPTPKVATEASESQNREIPEGLPPADETPESSQQSLPDESGLFPGDITSDAAIAAVKSKIGFGYSAEFDMIHFAPVPEFVIGKETPSSRLVPALSNQHMPPAWREKFMQRITASAKTAEREHLARMDELPQKLMQSFAGDLAKAVRMATHSHPQCPDALKTLVNDHMSIAQDWSTPADELVILSRSPWDCIRMEVALNPNTGRTELIALAKDAVPLISFSAACNVSAPFDAMLAFAEHRAEFPLENLDVLGGVNAVRTLDEQFELALGRHRKAVSPEEFTRLLKLLANTTCGKVQAVLSRDPLTSPEVLRALWEQSDLQPNLCNNPQTPADLLALMLNGRDSHRVVMHNSGLLKEANTYLKDHIDKINPYGLEKHPVPAEVLTELIKTKGKFVDSLIYLAVHPNLSDSDLEELLKHSDPKVRLSALYNPKINRDRRYKLLEEELIAEINGARETAFLVRLFEDPETPPEILRKAVTMLGASDAGLASVLGALPEPDRKKVIMFFEQLDGAGGALADLRNEAQRTPVCEAWKALINTMQENTQQQIRATYGGLAGMAFGFGSPPKEDRWMGKLNDMQLFDLYGIIQFAQAQSTNRRHLERETQLILKDSRLDPSMVMNFLKDMEPSDDERVKYNHYAAVSQNTALPLEKRQEYARRVTEGDARFTHEGIRHLIEAKFCPPGVRAQILAKDKKNDDAICRSAHTEPELLNRLARDRQHWKALVANPNSNAATLRTIAEGCTRAEHDLIRGVLTHTNAEPKDQYQMICRFMREAQENTTKLEPVSRHPKAPLGNSKVRMPWTNLTVAQVNESLPTILNICLTNQVTLARFISSMHPKLPEASLHNAARSKEWLVRTGAALNPSLSESDRAELLKDSNSIVRKAAEHRSLEWNN